MSVTQGTGFLAPNPVSPCSDLDRVPRCDVTVMSAPVGPLKPTCLDMGVTTTWLPPTDEPIDALENAPGRRDRRSTPLTPKSGSSSATNTSGSRGRPRLNQRPRPIPRVSHVRHASPARSPNISTSPFDDLQMLLGSTPMAGTIAVPSVGTWSASSWLPRWVLSIL